MANIAGRDLGSTTGINLAFIKKESGQNPWESSSFEVLKNLQGPAPPPRTDEWRIPYLEKLLKYRHTLEQNLCDTTEISQTIDTLCSS